MVEPPPPTLRLNIDRDALAHNWHALDRLSGAASAGAAVKADAYGLGVNICVPVLCDAGAELFFVAHWSEVADVAEHVPANRIAVLHGPATAEDATYARATGAVPVINSLQQAQLWIDSGGGACHLMIDTGINRLGVEPHHAGSELVSQLEVDILMSHLACADEDSAMNARQLNAFLELIPHIPHRRTSLANSAGIGLGSDYHFNVTRPGLSLYGGIPRPELAEDIRQVVTPEAQILQVRNICAGDSVGYNATYTAMAEMRVGVVSLGYADGMLRSWAGANLQCGDALLPILGRVSMDMVVVDLALMPDLQAGDWVQLPYSLLDAAQQSGLSQYELLTVLGHRLKTA